MRVAVDVMGGDNAPHVEVEGAVAAAREFGVPVTLVGDTERVRAELSRHNVTGLDIEVKHASEVVGCTDSYRRGTQEEGLLHTGRLRPGQERRGRQRW